MISFVQDSIKLKKESDRLDIKLKYYSKEKKYDLVKDVVSLLNNEINDEKYIVFGIEDKTWNIVGINKEDIPEIAHIENFLNDCVEPKVNVEIEFFEIDKKHLACLKICNNNDRPYLIKKTASLNGITFIRKGECYIRKGTTNDIATRHDLDLIYKAKNNIVVNLNDDKIQIHDMVSTIEKQKFLVLDIRIDNGLSQGYEISKVKLRIKINNQILILDNCKVSCEYLSSTNGYFITKDKPLFINANSSIYRYFHFLLTSNLYNKFKKGNIENLDLMINSEALEKDFKLLKEKL